MGQQTLAARPQPARRHRDRRRRTFEFALLGLLVATATTTSASELGDLVATRGFYPLEPAEAAPAFELPNLAGKPVALASFRKQWVLLTFFATWCGPCRSELPSLERLHQSRPTGPLRVVGISIDRDQAALEPFVAGLGLTFPVLWDGAGRAGAAYGAASIPFSVLIDPAGRAVAVARGARDWSGLGSFFDSLAGLSGGGTAVARAPAVAVPPPLVPPSATAEVSNPRPKIGEPFELVVKVRWSGRLADYMLSPPELTLPEGVEQKGVAAESSSVEGASLVTYRFALAGTKAGKMALDPIEVRVTPHREGEPLAQQIAGPTVEVAAATIAGLSPTGFGLAAAALGLTGLALVQLGRRLSARPHQPVTPARELEIARLCAALEAARGRQIEGNAAGRYLALASLAAELCRDEAERAEILAASERARYGALAPPAAEIERLERALCRRLAELEAAGEGEAKAAIKLAPPGRAGIGLPSSAGAAPEL